MPVYLEKVLQHAERELVHQSHLRPTDLLDIYRRFLKLEEHRLRLEHGDRLLLFTDGLVERRGVDLDIGIANLMFAAERTHRGSDPQAACDAVLHDMLPGSHEDDACLLIVDFDH